MPTPTARRSPGFSLALGALLICGLVAQARPGHAAEPDPAVLDNIVKLNRKAVDEYQNLNFDEARKILQNALEVAKDAGLDSHPATARTYVHLGVVVFAGFKQRDEAVKFFRKALEIQPDIKLDRSLATPEIQEVYDSATAGRGPEAVKPAKPAEAEGITHEPITRSAPGRSIVVRAEVAASVGAKKVVLSYNADGGEDFAERDMKEDPPGSGVYTAEIPASATQGAVVEYYIEALDDEGKTLASKGSAEKAMRVALGEGRGTSAGAVSRKKKELPKKEGDEQATTWFLGLGLGSGFGWASGTGDVSQAKVSPTGFAPSTLGHLVPELGYFVNPSLMVSAQLRLQYVTGATPLYTSGNECGGDGVCSPAWNALALFARASYFLSEGDFRPYVAGTLGAGQIRHVAKFPTVMSCGSSHRESCVDTVPAGPVFLGGGGGFLYALSPGFDLTLGANALLGFTNFTFHLDINAGVAFTF